MREIILHGVCETLVVNTMNTGRGAISALSEYRSGVQPLLHGIWISDLCNGVPCGTMVCASSPRVRDAIQPEPPPGLDQSWDMAETETSDIQAYACNECGIEVRSGLS